MRRVATRSAEAPAEPLSAQQDGPIPSDAPKRVSFVETSPLPIEHLGSNAKSAQGQQEQEPQSLPLPPKPERPGKVRHMLVLLHAELVLSTLLRSNPLVSTAAPPSQARLCRRSSGLRDGVPLQTVTFTARAHAASQHDRPEVRAWPSKKPTSSLRNARTSKWSSPKRPEKPTCSVSSSVTTQMIAQLREVKVRP